jgi:hypothetical protein
VQAIHTQYENLFDTQTQHIQNIYHWNYLDGHVLVGVNPCRRCAIVALQPQIAKLLKTSQNNGLKHYKKPLFFVMLKKT